MNKGIADKYYFERFYGSRDWRWYKWILSCLVKLSEPGPILDLGAGVGFFVELAKRWNLECFGLEGSESAVQMAKERNAALNIEKHLLSNPLPFPDGYFMSVVMNQVIEHLEPEIAHTVLDEIFRVLKPGGILFIASPNKFNLREKKADETHIHLYSPKELNHILLKKGYERIQPFNSPMNLLGNHKFAVQVMLVVFKILKWDILSATANCYAFKPK